MYIACDNGCDLWLNKVHETGLDVNENSGIGLEVPTLRLRKRTRYLKWNKYVYDIAFSALYFGFCPFYIRVLSCITLGTLFKLEAPIHVPCSFHYKYLYFYPPPIRIQGKNNLFCAILLRLV